MISLKIFLFELLALYRNLINSFITTTVTDSPYNHYFTHFRAYSKDQHGQWRLASVD